MLILQQLGVDFVENCGSLKTKYVVHFKRRLETEI